VSDRNADVVEAPLGVNNYAEYCEHELSGGPVDLFRSLFESSGLCLACVDLGQRVVHANDEFLRMVNRDDQQVRGQEIADALHPGFAVSLRCRLSELTAGRSVRFTENVMVLRRDGGTVSGDLTGVAVRAGSDRPQLVIVLFTPYRAVHEQPSGDRDLLLTDAGARVLESVAAGASTNWMASHLYLSRQGVDYHVRSMLRKLDVPNRPALVSRAYALGILRPGEWPPKVAPDWIR
jgi:PAS domain S-box-containing protein